MIKALGPMAALLLFGAGMLPVAAQTAMLDLQITAPGGTETMLDLAALDAMPQESFRTGTIWTNGTSRFSGVPLAALLERMGVSRDGRGHVELVALNDYRVQIPMDEIGETAPIVATRVDGEPMPVREKGPYWVVYPYDRAAEFRTEYTFARSIWQLAEVRVAD